jgi:hypothetical protein
MLWTFPSVLLVLGLLGLVGGLDSRCFYRFFVRFGSTVRFFRVVRGKDQFLTEKSTT